MFKLADLLADALAQLPEERQQAIESLLAEFGGGESFRFLLTLTAGTTWRERQLIRLFLRELDKLDRGR